MMIATRYDLGRDMGDGVYIRRPVPPTMKPPTTAVLITPIPHTDGVTDGTPIGGIVSNLLSPSGEQGSAPVPVHGASQGLSGLLLLGLLAGGIWFFLRG